MGMQIPNCPEVAEISDPDCVTTNEHVDVLNFSQLSGLMGSQPRSQLGAARAQLQRKIRLIDRELRCTSDDI